MMRALLTIGLLVSASSAAALTGEVLLDECRNDGPSCLPYVTGVIDGVRLGIYQSAHAIDPGNYEGANEFFDAVSPICPPPTVTNSDITLLVTAYLLRHPDKLDGDASPLIIGAARDAFPCR